MRRTTITLPEDLAERVEREARREESSVSEIIRGILLAHFGRGGKKRKLPFASLGRSGRRHTARDAEAILAREWGDARRR